MQRGSEPREMEAAGEKGAEEQGLVRKGTRPRTETLGGQARARAGQLPGKPTEAELWWVQSGPLAALE